MTVSGSKKKSSSKRKTPKKSAKKGKKQQGFSPQNALKKKIEPPTEFLSDFFNFEKKKVIALDKNFIDRTKLFLNEFFKDEFKDKYPGTSTSQKKVKDMFEKELQTTINIIKFWGLSPRKAQEMIDYYISVMKNKEPGSNQKTTTTHKKKLPNKLEDSPWDWTSGIFDIFPVGYDFFTIILKKDPSLLKNVHSVNFDDAEKIVASVCCQPMKNTVFQNEKFFHEYFEDEVWSILEIFDHIDISKKI